MTPAVVASGDIRKRQDVVESLRQQVGLVFVGDGSSRPRLEEQASSISPGVIKFTGFAQRNQLAQQRQGAETLQRIGAVEGQRGPDGSAESVP